MCSMVFLVNLARIVFSPLLEPLKLSFGVSNATVGFLATLVWLGSASPRIAVGYALTRVPRHQMILIAGGVLTVSAVFASVTQSIESLMVASFFLGASSGTYFIAANPLVSELFPDRVGNAIGIHGMSSQLAAVVAAPIVALSLIAGSWRLTFQLLAILAVVISIVLAVAASRTALPDAGQNDRRFVRAARRQWRIILAGIVVAGLTGFVWNSVFNFYVTYLVTTKSLSTPAAQGLLTVLFAAGVPAFLITGSLADRVANAPLLFFVSGTFACCLLVLTVTTGYLPLLLVSVVLGYVIHGLFPSIDTFLLASLPDHSRASAYALYSGNAMIVMALGSSVLGYLINVGYSFDSVFRAFAFCLFAVLILSLLLYANGRFPTAESQ